MQILSILYYRKKPEGESGGRLDFSDDDDEFVDTKRLNTNSSRKSSWSMIESGQNEIDEIFGSPSPMSRLKNARRSNKESLVDGDCHSKVWLNFNEPDQAALPATSFLHQNSSEEEDLDDIPLVKTGRWAEVEEEDEEDEVINLESDFDDYEVPLENLERDVLTQQLRSDWEEEEDVAAATVDREDFGDSEEEVFGPSPMKQPPARLARLSLGEESKVLSSADATEPVIDDPKLLGLVHQALDLRKKLFKNKHFHKHISKLIIAEAMDLHSDYQALKQLVIDIFEDIPFQKLSSVSESLCRDLDLIRQCLSKLKKRLLEFEENQQSCVSEEIVSSPENDGSPPFDALPGLDSGRFEKHDFLNENQTFFVGQIPLRHLSRHSQQLHSPTSRSSPSRW